jgi:hypothetical protein
MTKPKLFEETLLIIRTITSLPLVRCNNNCGYTILHIYKQLEKVFPDKELNLEKVTRVILHSTKRGVFIRNGYIDDKYTYSINKGMVAVNYSNVAYANAQVGYKESVAKTFFFPPVSRGSSNTNYGSLNVSNGNRC